MKSLTGVSDETLDLNFWTMLELLIKTVWILGDGISTFFYHETDVSFWDEGWNVMF